MTLRIEIEDYLKQWFIHDQGGNIPVKLRKGSIESMILEQFLQPLPKGKTPDVGTATGLEIIIPTFKLKSPEFYNYLPPEAMKALVKCIRNRFDVVLWETLHKISPVFQRQDNLIYAFMEKHGIGLTETNWNAIAKRYQRKRNYYLTYERTKRMKKKRIENKD